MKRKLKILRIIHSLDPKLGGPTKATIDSSLALLKQNFIVDIATSDLKNSKFYRSRKIRIINAGPCIGRYNLNIKLFLWILNHRHKYDAFIIHGLWQFQSLLARILLKKRYFIFTHGQLDPYFGTNINKNFLKKIYKKIYWFIIERKNLLSSQSVLLTSLGEKESLKKTFVNTSGIKKKIIRYGIIKPKISKKRMLKKFFKRFSILKNKKFYLFLGRFHEKKGCEIIVESVKKLKDNFKNIILFVGPITESKYELEVKYLIKKYNLQKKIIISDALSGDLKWGAIIASRAMVLASHGENFGVSLVESLSLGKPVITTNKVNISNEILKFKAGFISRNQTKQFSYILKKFDNLKNKDLKKLSKNARNCFKKNFDLSLTKNDLGSVLKKNIP